MVGRRRQLPEEAKKTLHATILGAFVGLVSLLLSAMVVQSVRLQFLPHSLPVFAESLSPQFVGLYMGLGGITTGGLVALSYVRYQTKLPAIVTTVGYLLAVSWTAWQVHIWAPPSEPREAIPPLLPWVTVLEYVLLGWPLLLGLALGSGLVEHRFRRPEPEVTTANST